MRKSCRTISFLLLLLAWVIAIAGCSQGSAPSSSPQNSGEGPKESAGSTTTAPKAEKIKIGVIVAETGPASPLGKPEADAAKLIKKRLEAQGPVNGKEIEIIIKDYETNDTKAIMAMKELISKDNVVAVVGATQVSANVAIRNVALESKVPLISLAQIPQYGDYVFGVVQTHEAVLMKMINYLKQNNIKTVAWTNARDGFGQEGLEPFKKLAATHGIEIVAVEEFDPNATDMTVQLTKIKPKNPGAILVWSRVPAAGIIAKNYKQLGFTIPMIQSHGSANVGFLNQVGAEGDGILVVGSKLDVTDQLPDSDQKKMLQEYNDNFSKEYKYAGGMFSAYAYDGLELIIKAISEGNDTPEKIRNYLENGVGTYKAVSGTLKLSKDNHNGMDSDGMALLKVNNKNWKFIE